ncbi:MAG: UdgX family uracil-DNA binding protein [Acidobacteriaceae bacterium]
MPRIPKSLQTAAGRIPATGGLPVLREAASCCTACNLYIHATQTVFGEGSSDADLFFVGEQPGDYEDETGSPFAGAGGRYLEICLREAGIPHERVYLTNVVKHFKWEPRGSRRVQAKPHMTEILACAPWLMAELRAVRPKIIVCLGATAAKAVLGKDFRVTQSRGMFVDVPGYGPTFATLHPSSVLRITGEMEKRRERERFINDLRRVVSIVDDYGKAAVA